MSIPLDDLQLGSPDSVEIPLTLTSGVPTILDELTLEFVGTPIEGPQGRQGERGIEGRPGIDGIGIPGPPGPPGIMSFDLIENEVPVGLIDGVNCVFTIEKEPIAGSIKVYSDGLRLTPIVDYTVNNKEIVLLIPPITSMIADYRTENI